MTKLTTAVAARRDAQTVLVYEELKRAIGHRVDYDELWESAKKIVAICSSKSA